MTRMLSGRTWRFVTAAGFSLAVLGTAAACREAQGPAAPAMTAGPGGQPMLVSCGDGQQPLIRQVPVNGAWVPQVECVVTQAAPAGQTATVVQAPMFAPAAAPAAVHSTPLATYPAQPVQMPAVQPVATVHEPMVVERTPVRQAPARRVVYDGDYVELEPRKKNRSWQKSAIIIGSSAGVGAATGGKKGALIGAAIGGGAATIWDQATRRR